jgi:hypothetical protein
MHLENVVDEKIITFSLSHEPSDVLEGEGRLKN